MLILATMPSCDMVMYDVWISGLDIFMIRELMSDMEVLEWLIG
jgi:hypothetical protein